MASFLSLSILLKIVLSFQGKPFEILTLLFTRCLVRTSRPEKYWHDIGAVTGKTAFCPLNSTVQRLSVHDLAYLVAFS